MSAKEFFDGVAKEAGFDPELEPDRLYSIKYLDVVTKKVNCVRIKIEENQSGSVGEVEGGRKEEGRERRGGERERERERVSE